MIPPLVAMITTAKAPDAFQVLLDELNTNGVPQCGDPALSALQHLPHPALRRLVPETTGPEELVDFLDRVSDDVLVPGSSNPAECQAVRAGLLQIFDCLEPSHVYAQRADDSGKSQTGAYWHGIMHRREPDYGNAAYWFRRVGNHPTFERIGFEAQQLLAQSEFSRRLDFPKLTDAHGDWDPLSFNDLCRQCGTEWNEQSQAASKLQSIEMRVLLEFTCQVAGR